MAQVPEYPTSPLELLTNKNIVQEPYVNKYWGPCLLGGFMFLGVCVANWQSRRPMMSGIQKHIGFTLVGAVLGKYASDIREEYFAERDAVYRHYVQLHPEDFPPYERKKFKDVLESWHPIR